MSISKNLKEARLAAKLSQEQVAEQLFVTRQTVSGWETGRTQPDLETLGKLTALYGVGLDRIIYGDREHRWRRYWNWAVAGILIGYLVLALGLALFGLAVTLNKPEVLISQDRPAWDRYFDMRYKWDLWMMQLPQLLGRLLPVMAVLDLVVPDQPVLWKRCVGLAGFVGLAFLVTWVPGSFDSLLGPASYIVYQRFIALPNLLRYALLDLLGHGIKRGAVWLRDRKQNRP